MGVHDIGTELRDGVGSRLVVAWEDGFTAYGDPWRYPIETWHVYECCCGFVATVHPALLPRVLDWHDEVWAEVLS